MNKTPLSTVKERFSSKADLVEAVQKLATDDLWIDRLNSTKGLAKVSNRKLVRLHDLLSQIKKDFGSRDKLVGAILTAEKREKDEGYKTRLGGYALPRLFDHYRAVSRRQKRAADASAGVKKPKPKATAAPKKAAPAAKKPAAKKAGPKSSKAGAKKSTSRARA